MSGHWYAFTFKPNAVWLVGTALAAVLLLHGSPALAIGGSSDGPGDKGTASRRGRPRHEVTARPLSGKGKTTRPRKTSGSPPKAVAGRAGPRTIGELARDPKFQAEAKPVLERMGKLDQAVQGERGREKLFEWVAWYYRNNRPVYEALARRNNRGLLGGLLGGLGALLAEQGDHADSEGLGLLAGGRELMERNGPRPGSLVDIEAQHLADLAGRLDPAALNAALNQHENRELFQAMAEDPRVDLDRLSY